jgi:hypothetical protein
MGVGLGILRLSEPTDPIFNLLILRKFDSTGIFRPRGEPCAGDYPGEVFDPAKILALFDYVPLYIVGPLTAGSRKHLRATPA